MKIALLCIIIVTTTLFSSNAQVDSNLMRSLQAMVGEDYIVRAKIDSISNKYGPNSFQMKAIWKQVHAIDRIHNPILKKIIKDAGGYPPYSLIGEQGADHFWNLVQHQDDDTAFQKQVLGLMKLAVANKQASSEYYAYLLDRVKLNCGQKQVYGTQCWVNKEGTRFIPRPLEDSLNVNKRRAQMGMETIELYLHMVNRQYGEVLKKE